MELRITPAIPVTRFDVCLAPNKYIRNLLERSLDRFTIETGNLRLLFKRVWPCDMKYSWLFIIPYSLLFILMGKK